MRKVVKKSREEEGKMRTEKKDIRQTEIVGSSKHGESRLAQHQSHSVPELFHD